MKGNTIREQAIAETPTCVSPTGREVLYQLSYRRMERLTGLEPATSRLSDDVTAIFTTDRERDWRGTGDAVAALLGAIRFSACGSRARSARSRLTTKQQASSPPPMQLPGNSRPLVRAFAQIRCARVAPPSGTEETDDFTTGNLNRHAGERAKSVSVTSSRFFLRKNRNPRHDGLASRLHGT